MSKWANRLKNQKSEGGGTDKADKSPSVSNVSVGGGSYPEINPPFVGNVSAPPPLFENHHNDKKRGIARVSRAQILSPSSPGHDHPAANQGSLLRNAPAVAYGPGLPELPSIGNPGLPSELFTLAVRYCVEQYGDSVEQVGEMISDLMEQSECWPEWISFIHFRLGIPKEVRCIDCIHAVDTGKT